MKHIRVLGVVAALVLTAGTAQAQSAWDKASEQFDRTLNQAIQEERDAARYWNDQIDRDRALDLQRQQLDELRRLNDNLEQRR